MMTIKMASSLVFIIKFIFTSISSILLLILYSIFIQEISILVIVLISMVFSLIEAILELFLYNRNIIVLEKDKGIGGLASEGFKLRKQQFVFNETIDLKRSENQSQFEKLIGRYKIYDLNGNSFQFNRHFFFKNDFNLIELKLHELLGVNLRGDNDIL